MGWTSSDGWYGQAKIYERHPPTPPTVHDWTGNGMKNDIDAVREAAEQGDAKARFILGMMYATGRGMPFDYVQAHVWLSLSESQKYKNATKERRFVVAHMTLAQITQAKELVRNRSMVRA